MVFGWYFTDAGKLAPKRAVTLMILLLQNMILLLQNGCRRSLIKLSEFDTNFKLGLAEDASIT